MALNRVSIATRGYRCNGNPNRPSIATRGYRCPQVGAVVIPVPTGSLLLNGFPPSALGTISVDVPTGTMTLTGLNPSLNFGIVIPTGAMTLTGLQPIANIIAPINVPTGQLNLQGLPPFIIIDSGDQLIAVPTGELILQGIPPAVLLEIIELPFDEQRNYLVQVDDRIFCVWDEGRMTTVEAPEVRLYNAGADQRIVCVEWDPDFKVWEQRTNVAPSDEGEE